MSAIQQRHLLEVLQTEIKKVPDAERTGDYGRHLKEHLITVLAFEREHRTKGINIKEKVTGQVEALASSLVDSAWEPGVAE